MSTLSETPSHNHRGLSVGLWRRYGWGKGAWRLSITSSINQNDATADDDFDAQLLGTRCDPYGTLRVSDHGSEVRICWTSISMSIRCCLERHLITTAIRISHVLFSHMGSLSLTFMTCSTSFKRQAWTETVNTSCKPWSRETEILGI